MSSVKHNSLIYELQKERRVEIDDSVVESIRAKFTNNYFGLPPYAMQQSAGALAYQCRKPMAQNLFEQNDHHSLTSAQGGERSGDGTRGGKKDDDHDGHGSGGDGKAESMNYIAQRKVASALLTMVSNPLMLKHFLYKGGYDAVLRLIGECK